ncbi:hypothetical protein PF005_g25179 [Phytophthora fragariae]|uniref:BZIP domain-containing protein n=1 Tax=Phytophthora fragariae TaxID=53985 RepID=A0A6A3W9W8_9STRA|nr:hypothetical protein PF003_g34561 [Phytophthora fragariae]KAE8923821.1 hypothetical protein PF009_g25935 [Phytophthora fragariae]KAE8976807.1 hypothetical protein PF011_g23900 [Phytophthora fragariae]KAE9074926.1 hypothetical protein PF007_g25209 [Phytophthora fragariae]KAE9095641.1 hypothetical protein PF006_g23964 [Phytophthora fragariae]
MASSFILYPKTFNLNDGIALQRITPLQGQFDNDNSFVGLERLPPLRTAARLDRESKLNVSASRREKCRINQARYRTRKRQHADKLDESIQQLQNEIQVLEAKRQVIEQSASTTQSVWVVATDYFRHFRHGFKAPSTLAVCLCFASISASSSAGIPADNNG